jgi:hypothetical protein
MPAGSGRITRTEAPRVAPGSVVAMAFERPAPDLQKLIAAWEQFEVGEEAPGRVLANLKTAGLPEVLQQLAEEGWTPRS